MKKDVISGSRRRLVEEGIPEFAGRREFSDVIVRDLSNAGLVRIGGLDGMISGNGMYQPVTSDFAAEFIAFITDPRKSESSPSE